MNDVETWLFLHKMTFRVLAEVPGLSPEMREALIKLVEAIPPPKGEPVAKAPITDAVREVLALLDK